MPSDCVGLITAILLCVLPVINFWFAQKARKKADVLQVQVQSHEHFINGNLEPTIRRLIKEEIDRANDKPTADTASHRGIYTGCS